MMSSNPHHLSPTSITMIGRRDQANHQYDMSDFWDAANAGNMPAVSFLKAPNYQNGHSYTSDPIHEQNYLVDTINRLQNLPEWNSMVIIVTWDDSDGWYDHVMPQIVSQSNEKGCGDLKRRIDVFLDKICTTIADTRPEKMNEDVDRLIKV